MFEEVAWCKKTTTLENHLQKTKLNHKLLFCLVNLVIKLLLCSQCKYILFARQVPWKLIFMPRCWLAQKRASSKSGPKTRKPLLRRPFPREKNCGFYEFSPGWIHVMSFANLAQVARACFILPYFETGHICESFRPTSNGNGFGWPIQSTVTLYELLQN